MSVVGNNIRALRTLYGEGRDITQSELADMIGVTRETVNKWEAGTIGNVRTSNINRLRELFGLTVDDLRSEEKGLASRLRASRGIDACGTASEAEPCEVPLFTLRSLKACSNTSKSDKYVEVPKKLLKRHPRSFALLVDDASMALVLPNGCHAIVDPEAMPGMGSIVVVSLPGHMDRIMVRRMHRGATKVLLTEECENRHEDYVFEYADLHVIGTVVWYQAANELA